jgi:hypothetical protein
VPSGVPSLCGNPPADRLETLADLLADLPPSERREVIADLPPADRLAVAKAIIAAGSRYDGLQGRSQQDCSTRPGGDREELYHK